ncbi:hypothetical protein QR680_006996 [Steinernema hermaphroditum]|uniref:Uncharacterized protein n=1 Tax=Steinernema hermaphroditum TaxID=289476 RepID=A0AA39LY17_9BILA|nr:hypothetical protein QR680_006996 [Steinernema hermaphroditum]
METLCYDFCDRVISSIQFANRENSSNYRYVNQNADNLRYAFRKTIARTWYACAKRHFENRKVVSLAIICWNPRTPGEDIEYVFIVHDMEDCDYDTEITYEEFMELDPRFIECRIIDFSSDFDDDRRSYSRSIHNADDLKEIFNPTLLERLGNFGLNVRIRGSAVPEWARNLIIDTPLVSLNIYDFTNEEADKIQFVSSILKSSKSASLQRLQLEGRHWWRNPKEYSEELSDEDSEDFSEEESDEDPDYEVISDKRTWGKRRPSELCLLLAEQARNRPYFQLVLDENSSEDMLLDKRVFVKGVNCFIVDDRHFGFSF